VVLDFQVLGKSFLSLEELPVVGLLSGALEAFALLPSRRRRMGNIEGRHVRRTPMLVSTTVQTPMGTRATGPEMLAEIFFARGRGQANRLRQGRLVISSRRTSGGQRRR